MGLTIPGPLGNVGLAEDDRPRCLDSGDRRRVVRRHMIAEFRRSPRRAHPLRLQRIFHGDGEPVKNPPILASHDRIVSSPSAIRRAPSGSMVTTAFQPRVIGVDPGQVELEQLPAAQGLRAKGPHEVSNLFLP